MTIRTGPPSKAYDEGWERTFGRRAPAPAPLPHFEVAGAGLYQATLACRYHRRGLDCPEGCGPAPRFLPDLTRTNVPVAVDVSMSPDTAELRDSSGAVLARVTNLGPVKP